jgi:hypothetical protein
MKAAKAALIGHIESQKSLGIHVIPELWNGDND